MGMLQSSVELGVHLSGKSDFSLLCVCERSCWFALQCHWVLALCDRQQHTAVTQPSLTGSFYI